MQILQSPFTNEVGFLKIITETNVFFQYLPGQSNYLDRITCQILLKLLKSMLTLPQNMVIKSFATLLLQNYLKDTLSTMFLR